MTTKRLMLVVVVALGFGCSVNRSFAEMFTPLDFSASFNRRLQENAWGSVGMPNDLLDPSGATVFAGVPFAIPIQGNNFWNGYDPASSNDTSQQVLSVSADIRDATSVHTLINTYWGVAGPDSFAMVEAFGTGGAYARFDLIGNEDVRDFNELDSTLFTDKITPPTVNVTTWTGWQDYDNQRLDMQTFELPQSFQGETLTEVRFTDNGGQGFEHEGEITSQRIFVAGVTVAVPEPSTITLFTMFGLVGAFVAWRNRKIQ